MSVPPGAAGRYAAEPRVGGEGLGRYAVGISGASGVAYGCRVVAALLDGGHRVDVVVTPAGRQVLAWEMGLPETADQEEVATFLAGGPATSRGVLWVHRCDDLTSPLASGSVPLDGAAVVPCSTDMLSALATGRSENLLERIGDVALKEGRRLVVVPRETPLSRVHLRNMLTLAEMGAVVLPAMPGFYHNPRGIADLVDFIAGKVLNALGLEQRLYRPWSGGEPELSALSGPPGPGNGPGAPRGR